MSCSISEQNLHDLYELKRKFDEIDLGIFEAKIVGPDTPYARGRKTKEGNMIIELQLGEEGRFYVKNGYPRNQALQIARDLQNYSVEWAAAEYGEMFTYGWVKYDNTLKDAIVIELNVPTSIIRAREELNNEIDKVEAEYDYFREMAEKETQKDMQSFTEVQNRNELKYEDYVNDMVESSTESAVAGVQLSLNFEYDNSKETNFASINSTRISNIVVQQKKC